MLKPLPAPKIFFRFLRTKYRLSDLVNAELVHLTFKPVIVFEKMTVPIGVDRETVIASVLPISATVVAPSASQRKSARAAKENNKELINNKNKTPVSLLR
ncbi:hypothetical protein [Erwinia sp. HR93]|uniref:hypothetical protein n=1 Tax=Erwinia sp. HR93 TaxID=3094840 RepID=UPI002ADEC689|nr:hypothetical protein [Erwinia sp. HR93]MEA1062443.1 hypothetical protein [Erwinia sp. HR93]